MYSSNERNIICTDESSKRIIRLQTKGGCYVKKYKIMLVDDEPDILDLLEKALNM